MRLKLMALCLATVVSAQAQKGKDIKKADGIFATIETTKGPIVLELEYQKTPITVANFIALAEGTNSAVDPKYKGKRFFDGLKFHRVIADFMVQGGDPLGNGSGDPGYKFKDEITELKHDKGGILSMANSGPATNGSQFFITHKATPWLDGKHTVYGHVVEGMDVVNAIAQDDVITKVIIARNGAAAKKFDAATIFTTYFAGKADDDKKAALVAEEAKKQQMAAQEAMQKEYDQKYGAVKSAKVAYFQKEQKTATKTDSGLQYKFTNKAKGAATAKDTDVQINYAGYLADGSLFDSSYSEVNKTYGKYDEARMQGNGYAPFPFKKGQDAGLIPGFLEAANMMNIGDKMIAFIPAALGYGAKGAGNVIPPNSDIIFEIEMVAKK